MYPWRFYLDYIVHFFVSNSRHGTHSPFVYRLVDEVIYAKRRAREPRDKAERLILRLIERFGVRQVHRLGDELPAGQLDFVIADERNDAEKRRHQLHQLWPMLHPGSLVVIVGLYRNTEMKQLWQSIKAKPEVTVTVDLFHTGLVFFHRGQAKEDFKISY